jgi:hypothetical protein
MNTSYLALVLVLFPCIARAQWVDPFDTVSPAWVTDRYAPAGFQSVSFDGDNRLQITIDQTGSSVNRPAPTYTAPFFNTQGDQRPVDIVGGWSLSAQVYVSSAFDTTTGQLVQTNLWAETGTNSANNAYAIMGFTNASPTDPLNPDASDRAFTFDIFNGTVADPTSWFDVGMPAGFAFNAWHTLEETYTGAAFEYLLDGVVVDTVPSANGEDLQTASLEAYNFGQTDANGLNNYSVDWDNAIAAAVIPEPGSFALALGLASLALVWTQRRLLRRT